jgi:hypothetical protein
VTGISTSAVRENDDAANHLSIVGLALIVVGVLGGGLEIKEVKIPVLPTIPRALSFAVGCVLIALCLLDPEPFKRIFSDPNPPHVDLNPVSTPQNPPEPTPEKRTHNPSPQSVIIIFAANQRDLALKVQKYLVGEGYAASAIYSDFSELKDDNREKAGTIRIVYKDVSQNIEQKLTKELKQKFSSEMVRLVESLNENASSDLQIQFF